MGMTTKQGIYAASAVSQFLEFRLDLVVRRKTSFSYVAVQLWPILTAGLGKRLRVSLRIPPVDTPSAGYAGPGGCGPASFLAAGLESNTPYRIRRSRL